MIADHFTVISITVLGVLRHIIVFFFDCDYYSDVMEERKKIYVTHVNIRLSISFLLLKLISIELIAGLIIIFWHVGLAYYVSTLQLLQSIMDHRE